MRLMTLHMYDYPGTTHSALNRIVLRGESPQCATVMQTFGSGFIILYLLLQTCLTFMTALEDDEKINCYPDAGGGDETSCLQRNCIWQKPSNPKAPWCFFDPAKKYGYYVPGPDPQIKTPSGYYVKASRFGGQPNTGIHQKAVLNLRVDVEYQTKTRLRIRIRDDDNLSGRYEVPIGSNFPTITSKAVDPLYSVNLETTKFQFKVVRNITGTAIWDTSIGPVLFADQFLQLSTRLPSHFIYGFGEHEHAAFKHNSDFMTLGMFSRDHPPGLNANLYGVHPFYMGLEPDGKAHGVLLLNSNAMDVTIQPAPALTYRTIGGVLDFYFFMGPTPEQVVQQYTELIGRPVMPAYWALGFQLCRYGYNHLNVVKETVERNMKYGIPLDVQYGDIDYMERQLDFTINSKTYVGLPQFVNKIKEMGIRYISILDPAISANESASYEPYRLGSELNIWIRNSDGNSPIFNKVWPDYPNVTINTSLSWEEQVERYRSYVAFPDFTHPNIDKWWGKLIGDFHKTLDFDGLWIDMNEPAAFVHGSVHGCPNNSLEYPPYKPDILGSAMFDKTLCMSAKHHDGTLQYNAHSLYGWSQTAPTLRALYAATGKRGIVISRSTYPSSGSYSGHWLGDNTSKWGDLAASIIGMMEFSLFGIAYTGADICGFFQDTTMRLCERWMQLGAFYPFSRNHNGLGNKPQDPAYFGPEFARDAKAVLEIRYTLLPYLYTLFYDAHTLGSTVVRPLMHEFTADNATWQLDRQFLWGAALLITPVLKEGDVEVEAYIPNSRWFDYRTGKEIAREKRGSKVVLNAPLNYIPLHVRGGYVLPLQDPANNTMFSRRNPMGLLVALDDDKKARGHLFWDDGEGIDSISNNKFQYVTFSANESGLFISVEKNGFAASADFHFGHVTVFGLNDEEIESVELKDQGAAKKTFVNGVLKVWELKFPISESHHLAWSFKKKRSAVSRPLSSTTVLVLVLLASVVNQFW